MALLGGPQTEVESQRLYREACRLIPGGVSSPVRAMRSVGREHPLFAAAGEGAWLIDADGNRYVDWVLSWGPLIAGHAHPAVVEAVGRAAARGTSFGMPTALEVELAAEVVGAVPSLEMVRFVSSGTEATMSAVRLARGFTGRSKVLKFAGGYHGHVDALLAQAGSGLATLAIPATPGVPAAVTADTLIAEYNDLDAARALAEMHGDDLACVIVEPVAGNMGVVPAAPGFLEGLRTICNGTGALLIADEVITGFRVAYGGAQERLAFRPDLTCLGKILGGGLPAAAFGGRADVMQRLAPVGDVYQAGTLVGQPAGDGGRAGDAGAAARAGCLRSAGGDVRGGRGRPGAAGSDGEPGGRDADRVLRRRPGDRLPRCDGKRHRPLRAVPRAHAGAGRVPGAVAVRGDDAVPGAHGRAGGDDRRRSAGVRRLMASLLDEIRTRAAADSPLWERALLPGEAPAPEFEGRCPQPYLLGVEMIREGYLLHNGRARLFAQDDADLALLTGDYLYAAGLVEICGTGDLDAVTTLAQLIARLQPQPRRAAAARRRRCAVGLGAGRPRRLTHRHGRRDTGVTSARAATGLRGRLGPRQGFVRTP